MQWLVRDHWVRPGELALSAENSDAQWLAPEDFPRLAFPSERAALEELKASGG